MTEEFIDKNTGETVKRVPVPDRFLEPINKVFSEHSQHQRAFAQWNDQFWGALEQCVENRKKIKESQGKLHKTLQLVCKKMGLPKDDWIYQIQQKCMELRKPPAEQKPIE